VAEPLRHLHRFLLQNRYLVGIDAAPGLDLATLPHEVLMRLQTADPSWETYVPGAVVDVIKARRLFGYRA
jgi:hypothetical protein